jgi:hypothetical protein
MTRGYRKRCPECEEMFVAPQQRQECCSLSCAAILRARRNPDNPGARVSAERRKQRTSARFIEQVRALGPCSPEEFAIRMQAARLGYERCYYTFWHKQRHERRKAMQEAA